MARARVLTGVVLAAGASRRAGGAKALFRLGDRSYVEHTVDALHAAGTSEVVLVIAAPWGDAIREHVQERTFVRCVESPHPERGMFSSARVGLDGARSGAVLLALVDHPGVSAETVEALARAIERHVDADVVLRPRHAGAHGHPVALGGAAVRRLLAMPDDVTLRDALASAAEQLSLDVNDPAVLEDRDDAVTPARSS